MPQDKVGEILGLQRKPVQLGPQPQPIAPPPRRDDSDRVGSILGLRRKSPSPPVVPAPEVEAPVENQGFIDKHVTPVIQSLVSGALGIPATEPQLKEERGSAATSLLQAAEPVINAEQALIQEPIRRKVRDVLDLKKKMDDGEFTQSDFEAMLKTLVPDPREFINDLGKIFQPGASLGTLTNEDIKPEEQFSSIPQVLEEGGVPEGPSFDLSSAEGESSLRDIIGMIGEFALPGMELAAIGKGAKAAKALKNTTESQKLKAAKITKSIDDGREELKQAADIADRVEAGTPSAGKKLKDRLASEEVQAAISRTLDDQPQTGNDLTGQVNVDTIDKKTQEIKKDAIEEPIIEKTTTDSVVGAQISRKIGQDLEKPPAAGIKQPDSKPKETSHNEPRLGEKPTIKEESPGGSGSAPSDKIEAPGAQKSDDPVKGTGVPKKSRFFERVKQAVGGELDDGPDYNPVVVERETEAVVKLIEQDPARASRVASGIEAAPEGMRANTVAVGLIEKAIDAKDWARVSDLSTKVTLRSTRAGQEIQALRGTMGVDSPSSFVKMLVNNKLGSGAKRSKKLADIKEKAKSLSKIINAHAARTTKRAQKIIRDLEC